MSLGMNLQKVQMMSSAQRQKISGTMGLFKAGEDTGLLQQISSYVEQSQHDTAAAQQTAAKLCQELSSMLKIMEQIDKGSYALERAGLLLHVIGINTGIECSRYSQIESTFKVVAQDTTSLAEQIHKATDILLEKSTQAKNEQKKTLQQATTNIDSLEDLASDSKQATEIALSKVAELIDYSISMVNEAEKMAVNITSEINRVVMGIQFHDNLRQRIEHVNDALLESKTPGEEGSPEEACTTYLSIELQKAQLDNLVIELENLYTTQSQALGNILQEISSLKDRLASMVSKQTHENSSDNPVAALLHGITALERLNQDSLALGAEINESSRRSEKIVDNMHSAIKTTFTIANNVKINALNAIIKAAKFGRAGEALQVLAQGMVTVSKDTRKLVTEFNQLLEQLNLLTGEEESSATEKLKVLTDFSSDQLEQTFQDFRTELQASQTDCHTLTQNLEKEKQDLAFIARLKDAIAGYAENLESYAETIRPQDEALLARMRSSFGGQLEQRYTMNEERAIHDKVRQTDVFPEKIASQATDTDGLLFDQSPAATSNASDEVDLWDDEPAANSSVELFDDTPAENSPAPTDDVELWGDDTSSGDVELFDSEPEQTATGEANVELWDEGPETQENSEPEEAVDTQKKDKDEDLGDNVELF